MWLRQDFITTTALQSLHGADYFCQQGDWEKMAAWCRQLWIRPMWGEACSFFEIQYPSSISLVFFLYSIQKLLVNEIWHCGKCWKKQGVGWPGCRCIQATTRMHCEDNLMMCSLIPRTRKQFCWVGCVLRHCHLSYSCCQSARQGSSSWSVGLSLVLTSRIQS